MFTKFHNVSFDTNDVAGIEVDGNTLYIEMHTRGKVYELEFENSDLANSAQEELTNVLNGIQPKEKTTDSRTESVLRTAKETVESLQSVVDSLRNKAANKVTEVAIDSFLKGKLGSLGDIKGDIFSVAKDLSKMFETVVQDETPAPAPKQKTARSEQPKTETKQPTTCFSDLLKSDIFTSNSVFVKVLQPEAKTLTVEQFKLLFGTPDEPVIGDLSNTQLKELISSFVDDALENDRVKSLFQSIRKQFSPEEADAAVQGYKELILTFSLQNIEMTLSEVLEKFFS